MSDTGTRCERSTFQYTYTNESTGHSLCPRPSGNNWQTRCFDSITHATCDYTLPTLRVAIFWKTIPRCSKGLRLRIHIISSDTNGLGNIEQTYAQCLCYIEATTGIVGRAGALTKNAVSDNLFRNQKSVTSIADLLCLSRASPWPSVLHRGTSQGPYF